MTNVAGWLAQVGAAFSQLCALLSQLSLAVSQSSLVLGQLSVTVSQFIVAFGQISAALSQYAFLVSQLGGLALQLGQTLKRTSDAVDDFSRELRRFSVCAVQFGVGFRHVSMTTAHLGRAVRACARAGGACRLTRQASEAVCGLGVALGELAAVCGLFTALNSQLARVAGVQLVSRGGCLAVLGYAARVRQLSVGVAQLSAAVYQLSLALRHGALLARHWALVRAASTLCRHVMACLAQDLHRGCRPIIGVLSTCLRNAIRPIVNLAFNIVNKLESMLLMFGLEKSALDNITYSTTSSANSDASLILVQNVHQNNFSNLTFIFPGELLPLLGKIWKKKRREDEISDDDSEIVRFVKSRADSNFFAIALYELDSLCYQLQILDTPFYLSGFPVKQFSDKVVEKPPSIEYVPNDLDGSNKAKDSSCHKDPSADATLVKESLSPNIFVKVYTSFDCPECYPVCCYGVVGLNVLV